MRMLKREWVLSFAHAAWGRNLTRSTGFSLGVILPFTWSSGRTASPT